MKPLLKSAAAGLSFVFFCANALGAGPEMMPQPAQDALYAKAVEWVQNGEYDQAMAAAQQLLKMNPAGEAGYRIAVAVYWTQKQYAQVIFTVQLARRNGIESLFLNSYLTQALYYAGGLSAALQGFRRIEDLLERQSREQNR